MKSAERSWHLWFQKYFSQTHKIGALWTFDTRKSFPTDEILLELLWFGRGADISKDWACESASIQAEMSAVYLSKMGAAELFVKNNCWYVTLSTKPGLWLFIISL